MISLATLITKIGTDTTYRVRAAQAEDNELIDVDPIATTPLIIVGYGPIRNSHPEVITTFDLYEKNADDLVQSFYLKYVCLNSDFRTVFVSMYKLLSSYNPNAPGDVNTGFGYIDGAPLGFNNEMFWFLCEWRINFPTNTLLI